MLGAAHKPQCTEMQQCGGSQLTTPVKKFECIGSIRGLHLHDFISRAQTHNEITSPEPKNIALCPIWQTDIPGLLYRPQWEQQKGPFHMVPVPCNTGFQRNDNIAASPHWRGYHIHIGSYTAHHTISSLDDRLRPR